MSTATWEKGGVIAEQLGGLGKLSAMVGAHTFTYRPEGEFNFHFKMCRKANIVRVKLTEDDLYKVTFFRYSKRTYGVAQTKEYDGLFAEDLKRVFEEYTGLLLSL